MNKLIPAEVFDKTTSEIKNLLETIDVGLRASGSYSNSERIGKVLSLLTALMNSASVSDPEEEISPTNIKNETLIELLRGHWLMTNVSTGSHRTRRLGADIFQKAKKILFRN